VIETQTVDCLPTLGGKVEMASLISFREAKHCGAVLRSICYSHVRDRRAVEIKHNTLDFLSKLWVLDDDELSNCHCSWS